MDIAITQKKRKTKAFFLLAICNVFRAVKLCFKHNKHPSREISKYRKKINNQRSNFKSPKPTQTFTHSILKALTRQHVHLLAHSVVH